MTLIANKYKIIEKIGEGSFGTIYKGENIRNKDSVAIKIEKICDSYKLLKNEANIYQYLKDVPGVPNIKWFGKDEKHYYMVLPLLGDSLDILVKSCNSFSLELTKKIGIQLINIISSIHERGLIHRDIKPDNFLLGINDTNIYLIDFGFCKTYIQNGDFGQHIPMKKNNKLIGSVNYASIQSHELMELSRRDDLESIGYVLLYLYFGKLDWENDSFNAGNNDIIKYKKQKCLDNTSLPECIRDYLINVFDLEFSETPDYDSLKKLFE